uniref:Uncharacterized protein n=1 Tax=Salix viminalis TaxID=40686 RepID=A0A6N2N9W4_SALVM
MPAYCTKCYHVGHHMYNCMLLDNNVRPRQPLKHDETAPKNDTKIASNNNLKTATEGGKKNKEEWVEVRHKKAAHKHVENNAKGNPIPPLDKEESRKLDKDNPIQPQDKGKSIETDNHPILVDDAKTQDREIGKETPTDSMVGDSQPIGLCGLNTNDTIPSNCNTIDSTKSLNSMLSIEILLDETLKGCAIHFSKKDLGKRNLRAEFNETAIAKVIDAIPLNICLND